MSNRYPQGVISKDVPLSNAGGNNVTGVYSVNDLTTDAVLYGQQVQRSLRFRQSASAYLNRTPASASNRKTWTYSVWVKRGALSSGQMLLSVSAASTDNDRLLFYFGSGNTLLVDGATNNFRTTTQVFRDSSAWYHIVLAVDTTQATANNRMLLYVNGTQITAFSNTYNIAQNADMGVNAASEHNIGRFVAGANNYLDGYMAEVNFIDGQALDPTYFGQYGISTGVWQPKKYQGTFGTNGFYLPFSNTTSTTTLGYDFSGNNNNWTTNNISLTAGSTYDSMLDVPTNWGCSDTTQARGNYAVLNPLQTGSYATQSNGNLTTTGNTATNSALVLASIGNLTSGKWYWEYTQGTVASETCGVMTQNMAGIGLNDGEGTTNSYGVGVRANGNVYGAEKTVANITSWTTGDVIGLALDCDNGAIYWSKNGTWLNSGVPTSGASKTGAVGVWTPSATKVITPSFGAYNGGFVSATFGQRPFSYTPPSGFVPLCTQNLPIPTMQAGNQYFDVTTYTGNGSTQSIVNSGGFQPDFVWAKSRSNGDNHALYDALRGPYSQLQSNSTGAEGNYSPYGVTAFNNNGFALNDTSGGGYNVNGSGKTYVAWQWKAGNTSVVNTAGSITSQVSANTTSGFAVVTYTGNGTAGATVGHGLGVAPSFIITKTRSSVMDWFVYHVSLGVSQYLALNSTIAAGAATNYWGSSSTTFALSAGGNNVNGSTMVAYCFAAIPGYSAFGSYTGNGSADGPFIYTGFRPRFVLLKCSSTTENWQIYDTSRDPYNVAGQQLLPNTSSAEGTAIVLDILSNGFKLRNSTAGGNQAQTYIYAAFAENPFKYSLAR